MYTNFDCRVLYSLAYIIAGSCIMALRPDHSYIVWNDSSVPRDLLNVRGEAVWWNT